MRQLTQPLLPPTGTVRLVDLEPSEVAAWLEQVVPHLGDDETIPFLTAVHIRLAGGHVHAYATDRYTGALATLPHVSTDQNALFTIPAEFARRAIEWLRGEGLDPGEDGELLSVDLTISPRIFGLTLHLTRRGYWNDDRGGLHFGYEDYTARLATRIDGHRETINLPQIAADALAEPESASTVHVNARLLARFIAHGYGPVVPLDTTTGHLGHGGDLLAGYRVHNTGRVIVLTRADYIGFIATCRTVQNTTPETRQRETCEASTREHWRNTLAAIA